MYGTSSKYACAHIISIHLDFNQNETIKTAVKISQGKANRSLYEGTVHVRHQHQQRVLYQNCSGLKKYINIYIYIIK